jgi:hypothetical protein
LKEALKTQFILSRVKKPGRIRVRVDTRFGRYGVPRDSRAMGNRD